MARVPEEIIEAIRLGRLTALSKPDGGVRGDCCRRHLEEDGRTDVGEADLEEG